MPTKKKRNGLKNIIKKILLSIYIKKSYIFYRRDKKEKKSPL